MKHHIRTAAGVSDGYIKYDKCTNGEDIIRTIVNAVTVISGNIRGIGQGGGSSPIEWLAMLLVLINTFKTFAEGATVIDPSGDNSFKLHVLSYVDDNSILRSIKPGLDGETIFQAISQEMTHWLKILQVTGGDLALQKCHITLLKWKWGPTSGKPTLATIQDVPGTAIIDTQGLDNESIRQEIKRYNPSESERQLRVRLPIDGNFKQEYEYRMKQSQNLGWKLYRSPLTTAASYLMYKVYYSTALKYPLSITKFTKIQANNIQSKFYKYAMPKMGVNRHLPNVIKFGPYEYGGCQLMELYIKQLYQHIKELQKHIRRQDGVGKAFIANLNAMTVLTGSVTPIFQLNPDLHNYVDTSNMVYYLWKVT